MENTKNIENSEHQETGAPNVTYTMVWAHMDHQALRTKWFVHTKPWLTRLYNAMVWLLAAYHTLLIQWFGNAWLTKPWFDYLWVTKRYIYNGAGTHCSPNITNSIVRWPMAHQTWRIQWFGGRMAHQTLQLHWFECPRLTKRVVYNGLGTHGSPNLTHKSV